jgi:hypothetical protein
MQSAPDEPHVVVEMPAWQMPRVSQQPAHVALEQAG